METREEVKVTPLTVSKQTQFSSPLIDTIVTTTQTSSVTTAAIGSPSPTTPLLTHLNYPDSSTPALTIALDQLSSISKPNSSTIHSSLTPLSTNNSDNLATPSTPNSNINQATTSGNLSSNTQQSSPSNVSSATRSSVQSHFPLTLPHIDEDDEDENCSNVALLQQQKQHKALRIVENKVQSDNLLSCNNAKSFSSTDSSTSPSPKIKVLRIKFNQQQAPLTLSSSSPSSESETSVTTTIQREESKSPNKMQAESGSIAELQKYQNKYLKNRRHTLAANTAINLR